MTTFPNFSLSCPSPIPLPRGRVLATEHCAFIMGSFNATPDSFWTDSCIMTAQKAADCALAMQDNGADLIDIGAESTRPGAEYVSAEAEISRLIPIIEAIRRKTDIPISIDTRKYAVMQKCFDSGADILNDVSALRDDPLLADFAAKAEIPVVLMHKQGVPVTMQQSPLYNDVVAEVEHFLLDAAQNAQRHGIAPERIVLDPGFGFGKTTEHNCALLNGIDRLASHGYHVLSALSRKRFIGDITGRDAANRLAGTLTANMFAVMHGATMIRVHDVPQARDSLLMMEYLTGFSGSRS